MNDYVLRRVRRDLRRLARLGLYVSMLAGVLMLVLAAGLIPTSVPANVLLGVGSSVIASALFVFTTANREGPAETLIDQGVEKIFYNRQQAMDDDDWNTLMSAATKWYRVLGVANHGYIRASTVDATANHLRAALKSNVNVEILWLDPTHEIARLREVEEGNRGTRLDAIQAMKWFFDFRNGLPQPESDRLSLRTYGALPTNGITWVDDTIVVTHYLSNEQNRTCPGLVLRCDNQFLRAVTTFRLRSDERQLADKYCSAYRGLVETSKEIDDNYIALLNTEAAALPGDKLSEEQLRED